jgi:molybdopterin-synthase adenylyltransferase
MAEKSSAVADRYARQRIIPSWNQSRLADATAVIAGVGALGNETAKNLALAGVGRLILCDPDTVAVSNLSRTVLFGPGDVDRPKAEAAAAALRALSPGVVADARVADLAAGLGLGELADASVVVSCVDSVRARMRLLGRCALAGARLVDGGTHPFGGEVRLRLSPSAPCYGCTLSAHERGVSDVPWSCFGVGDDGPQPASITTTALVASWMSVAALGLILGSVPSYQVLSIDAIGGRTAPVSIDRDPACPHHRPLDGPAAAADLTNLATVGELLATLGPGEEPLSWEQFRLTGRCGGCGRPAGDRSGPDAGPAGAEVTVCRQCGGLIRSRLAQRLRDASPDARLCDLGIAPEEILPILTAGGEYRWLRLSR